MNPFFAHSLHMEVSIVQEAAATAVMRIGELAADLGTSTKTLRFYERRGLIQDPPRSGAGYREYPPDTVHRVRFIRRAQELGFTLAEIVELLELRIAD
ncbi:MAG: MerR family transcriptional regulator, partial [Geminicoccaceae bacterium]|nr:MerR family transcriptional regulator [Geminicoccaceae bacterium]